MQQLRGLMLLDLVSSGNLLLWWAQQRNSLEVVVRWKWGRNCPFGSRSQGWSPQGPWEGISTKSCTTFFSCNHTISSYCPHNTEYIYFCSLKSSGSSAHKYNQNPKLNPYIYFLLDHELPLKYVVSFHFPSKIRHGAESIYPGTNPDVSETSQPEGSRDIRNILWLKPEQNTW